MQFDRRLALGVLAAAGALITHELAYSALHLAMLVATDTERHGYLGLVWSIVGPLAVVAIGALGVRRVRNLDLAQPLNPRRLALTAGLAFSAMEAVEHTASGQSLASVLALPVLWIGLAMVLPVAYLLLRAVDTVASIVAPTFGPERLTLGHRPLTIALPVAVPMVSEPLRYSVSRRGPPVDRRI